MLLCPFKLSSLLFNISIFSSSLSLSLSLSLSTFRSQLHFHLSPNQPIQMKKFVLKLDLHDDRDKRKAMKTVSTLPGIDSIAMDMKGKKLTIIGTVDPVSVVSKLRKFWPTDIISVGPAKEPEKKEEPKKEEPKKEEPKKEEPKEEPKKEEPKKEEPKKDEPKKEEEKPKEAPPAQPQPPVGPPLLQPLPPPPPPMVDIIRPYRPYYPQHMNTHYYVNHHSIEENPNACVIC